MTRPADFHARAIDVLHDANEAAWRETDPEEGVRHFTNATRGLLGDPDAPAQPGALKPGETQFIVSACFFIAPSRDHMIVFADNFGLGRARISVTDSRPGHTVQTRQAAVVKNTDEDKIFRQIIKTGRVGCSIYVPVMWKGEVMGMFNTASQARYMYDEEDMKVQKLFAACAVAAWMGLGGPERVAEEAAGLGPWQP
ncbi:GAF domain-containing protein [Ancylobacter pratisalsi]|uniref:GAF domain-containing protein n=1 Tax=Ancylobacter pratisalsi TaxID=1745854 RepID=A0A6P1YT37_9HYPH|nr:GAF domain-containing protein [Ancylobacter pratisalsi]QIB35233.1 GAF domain-containing protein [Ancylobacter pratisalsi]